MLTLKLYFKCHTLVYFISVFIFESENQVSLILVDAGRHLSDPRHSPSIAGKLGCDWLGTKSLILRETSLSKIKSPPEDQLLHGCPMLQVYRSSLPALSHGAALTGNSGSRSPCEITCYGILCCDSISVTD